jgi:hypothetical protein
MSVELIVQPAAKDAVDEMGASPGRLLLGNNLITIEKGSKFLRTSGIPQISHLCCFLVTAAFK